MLIVAHILESNAPIWGRGLQADRVGINVLLLWGGGCVGPSALPGQDHKSRSSHSAGLSDVFTQDVIDTWPEYKREREVDAMPLRPHPYEFALYYDV